MKSIPKQILIVLTVATVLITIVFAEICAQTRVSQPVEYDQAVFDQISLGYKNQPFTY